MSNVDMFQELSNFIFTSKYARFDSKLKRRETWEEAINRVLNMHLKKFSFLPDQDKEQITKAFNLVRDRKVGPSSRTLQYAGKAVEVNNFRAYNCAVRHIDSLRSFAEVMHLSLSGVGVGLGLSEKYMSRLPNLVNANDKTGTVITYVVEDTIEGWADSIEALLNCYHKNTAYTGRKIIFDYSRIRRKGSPLKTSGGKAPGHTGLKKAHKKIKDLLDYIIEEKNITRLRTIDAYDMLMHTFDAVLSGGCRRSASSVIFDLEDELLLNAKVNFKIERSSKQFGYDEETKVYFGWVVVDGIKHKVELNEYSYNLLLDRNEVNWRDIYPHRARSNNSVRIFTDTITYNDFVNIIERSQQYGEPGFYFAGESTTKCASDTLANPCQPKDATIIIQGKGLSKFKDLKIGDYIWSKEGWTKVLNKWSTGIKYVHKYNTTSGFFYGTSNHKVVSAGVKTEVEFANSIDLLVGPNLASEEIQLYPIDIMDGLMIGDGTTHLTSKCKIYLTVGVNDQDLFQDEDLKNLFISKHPADLKYGWVVESSISEDELPVLPIRSIPDRFVFGSTNKKLGFLRGLYSANGSICGNRVTLKTTNFTLVRQVQLMLNSLGISSYYTTNQRSKVKWANGIYESRESYDLNISSDRELFYKYIGFVQMYKMENLNKVINRLERNRLHSKITYDINCVEHCGEQEVFDITVDNNSHTYWTGGCNVSNCFEINFVPVTNDGRCGVQLCNLTTINGAKAKTKEDFIEFVKAAALIGTLQAAYTDFLYTNKASVELTNEEALLGVSITGMMDNPKVLTDPENQRVAAKAAVEINRIWAKKIGINQAARVTTLKPEGSISLVFESASGIHPHHARKYFRRVQCNKEDNVYQYFKEHNEHMCEESVWSANKTDDIVAFPLQLTNGAKVKDDFTALEHLEIIKSTQLNWVNTGTTEANRKPIKHSVSCTVIVKDGEWEDVCRYLYENRECFTAVSLLPYSDKIYPQSPLERITEDTEEKFREILGKYKEVDYTKLIETSDETVHSQHIVCAGGKCDILI